MIDWASWAGCLIRFIIIVIFGLVFSLLFVFYFPLNIYMNTIEDSLLRFKKKNKETFIERVFRLYRTYFFLIFSLGFGLYFTQLSFIGNKLVYWDTYFIAAGFLFFMARVVSLVSEARKPANFELIKYLFGLLLLGFIVIFLAVIHILILGVKSPGEVLNIISSIKEILFLDFFWVVLIIFIFPFLLTCIGELVIKLVAAPSPSGSSGKEQ